MNKPKYQEQPIILLVDFGIAKHYKIDYKDGTYQRFIDVNKDLPIELMDEILVHEFNHYENYSKNPDKKSDKKEEIKHFLRWLKKPKLFWQLGMWEVGHGQSKIKDKFGAIEMGWK